MIKIIFLTSLLCATCLFANLAGYPQKTSLDTHFEGLYRIENDALIDYRGIRHPKIPFLDALHEDLCFILKDPEQAALIHSAYSHHLLPHLSGELHKAFSAAILKISVLLGSNKSSAENSLLAALREESADAAHWMNERPELLRKFMEEANRPARPHAKQKKESDLFTIAILTTSASGGNYSVAKAMESFLSSYPNVSCVVIDSETIAKESDPIRLATGAVTYDGIYASLFQQENQGMDILIERDILSKQLGRYIPSCFGLKLKEKIREIDPDLILSTRSYTLDDIPLCTLGIPFRMIHCDYELSFFLMDLYGKIQPDMLKFWLPSLEPQIFRPLFAKKNRLDLYNERDTFDQIMEKIATMTQEPVESIQSQFELLGYPISPEFQRIEDCSRLNQLREKWNLRPEEIPVLISMGKNGVGVLEEIFDELNAFPEQQLPIRYIFICGKNTDLKKILEQKSSERFQILGLVSPEEMNELMNLCPLKISKPGGAIASEALETGTFLLMTGLHPWEEANASMLERHGLGQRADADLPLHVQVEDWIHKRVESRKIQGPKWDKIMRDRLDHIRQGLKNM